MKRLLFLFAILLTLSACTEVELGSHVAKQAMPTPSQGTFKVGTPYKVEGRRYYPQESYDLVETGIASWYGQDFQGKKTANGETFDMNELTAAHRTLQMPSLVRVTNLENGRSIIVRVNDRGPYKRSRVMDVSMRAAELLGFKNKGTAKVKLEVLKQESLQIASAAKSGINTKGYEVALNTGRPMPSTPAVMQTAPIYGEAAPAPGMVAREPVIPVSAGGQVQALDYAIPGHTRNGQFYPDPVVTEEPVVHTDIYIQAGSFTQQDNAYRLSANLQNLGKTDVFPAMVGGRQFYRVRLGPVSTVEAADELLARVVAAGQGSAIIVVQ